MKEAGRQCAVSLDGELVEVAYSVVAGFASSALRVEQLSQLLGKQWGQLFYSDIPL